MFWFLFGFWCDFLFRGKSFVKWWSCSRRFQRWCWPSGFWFLLFLHTTNLSFPLFFKKKMLCYKASNQILIKFIIWKTNEILQLKPRRISSFQHCTLKILMGPRCLIMNHTIENGRKKSTYASKGKWVIGVMCHWMKSQNNPQR